MLKINAIKWNNYILFEAVKRATAKCRFPVSYMCEPHEWFWIVVNVYSPFGVVTWHVNMLRANNHNCLSTLQLSRIRPLGLFPFRISYTPDRAPSVFQDNTRQKNCAFRPIYICQAGFEIAFTGVERTETVRGLCSQQLRSANIVATNTNGLLLIDNKLSRRTIEHERADVTQDWKK
jgi:hypothetical protein